MGIMSVRWHRSHGNRTTGWREGNRDGTTGLGDKLDDVAIIDIVFEKVGGRIGHQAITNLVAIESMPAGSVGAIALG